MFWARGFFVLSACLQRLTALTGRFCVASKTWRRPTLPRLETQYHGRWGISRPSSGWDRVQAPRHGHQVVEATHFVSSGISPRPGRDPADVRQVLVLMCVVLCVRPVVRRQSSDGLDDCCAGWGYLEPLGRLGPVS